ncbi:hypothetical protein [Bacillus wiedmannii]|jgi:RecB family endonuclease NucS|uniref:Uncharacterized protein n=1 Tax=Bacillus wiedmannii TaxID=1890302 RepID=A0A1C4FBD0_9BACI|nr:hypothetical protein [Bacillus wiedmannii]SCC53180.1 Uncharacterized protein BC05F1_04222 [Bacillus wiedmannii]SCL90241.1 Uncharacterized protein BCRIVMBC120_01746 [Bacillus wiedmannii]
MICRTIRVQVPWEFVSTVTEENMKQKLESTPGLLVNLFKTCKRNHSKSKESEIERIFREI